MAKSDEQLLSQFSEWLESRELAEATKKSYRGQIKAFLRYCNRYRTLSGLNTAEARKELAMRYFSYERTVRHVTEGSLRGTHVALNQLWQFLGVEYVELNWEKIPEHPPRILTGKERRRFIKSAKRCSNPRDRAMALLMLLRGIGLAECLSLKISDLKLDGKHSMIKIRRLGWVHLPRQVRRALAEWVALWNTRAKNRPAYKKQKLLLPVRAGTCMSKSEAHRIVTGIGKRCGVIASARTLQETYVARFLKQASKNHLVMSCRNNTSKFKRLSREQGQLVINLVKGGATVRRVAEIFGLHCGSIHRYLRKAAKVA